MLNGVSAALLNPRTQEGKLNFDALARQLTFLHGRGILSFALNGATGEFCLTTPVELGGMLETMVKAIEGRSAFIVGIGSASARRSIELAAIAKDAGAQAVLLPMPYFFRYSQDDLEAFSRNVAEAIQLPVILYNLPLFATGLEPQMTLKLITSCENIVGIKDSSGSLDTLRLLTLSGVSCSRIVGNDSVIFDALREGICDGAVSGIACALPELLRALYEAPAGDEAERLRDRLVGLIDHMQGLPTPWGLKVLSAARGITEAAFSQPLSIIRERELQKFGDWFSLHREELMAAD